MFRRNTTLRNAVRVTLVLAVLIIAAGVIIDRDTNEFTFQTAIGQTDDTVQAANQGLDFEHLERANRAFIDLVARTRPAVVQITTKTERIIRIDTPQRRQMSPDQEEQFRRFLDDDSPFRFFFPEELPQRVLPNPEPVRGIGSGVIVSEDGYILTNNHVIERSDEITVTLSDEKEYTAELVGRDAAGTEVSGTDLALLKIDAEGLPALPFGDSDQLEVGEWVIAIGTPLNFSQTVTRGIVSAKGRPGQYFSNIKYGNFIQTDAPINRGNSGGALINIRGELVGINTAIITGGLSSGNIGIGFAIPSKTAQQILPQLIKHGKVERGWLGISMRNVDPDMAEKLNFDTPRGVSVRGVSKDSPADKARIRRWDVIVEFNGETIRDSNHLMHVVAATEVGKSVEITVRRGNNYRQEKRLTVKLGKRTEEVIAKLNAQLEAETETEDMRTTLDELRLKPDEREAFAGLQVQNLTPEIAERYGYAPDEKGVVVTQVESGSNAEEEGIVPGSLIQEMEWTPIEDLESYSRLVEQLTHEKEKQVLLLVKSPNGQGGAYVTIKIPTSDR